MQHRSDKEFGVPVELVGSRYGPIAELFSELHMLVFVVE